MGSEYVRWLQSAQKGFLPNNLMPNTFLAVTIDFHGIKADTHEAQKQRVAKR